MRLPDVIPIKHDDYRADRIGRHAGGQFFADITGAYQEGVRPGAVWEHQRRIYAVLHRFDDDGYHQGSNIWFAGVTADNPTTVERAELVLTGWLSDLGPVSFGDIAIRPFRADFDDVIFGLIDETTDDPDEGHGGPWAELYPQRLGFHEPWDGEYDT